MKFIGDFICKGFIVVYMDEQIVLFYLYLLLNLSLVPGS